MTHGLWIVERDYMVSVLYQCMPVNLKDLTDEEFIKEVIKRIIPIESISPASGGHGEKERVDELCKILEELGYQNFKRYDVQDKWGATRSNVVLVIGDSKQTFWIIPHTDTVPVGDPALWSKPPFKPTFEGDKIYGRGTSDDGQAIWLSLLILKNLDASNLKYNLGFAFVADEEVGSTYGIQHLLEKDLFKKNDLIIVPDAGTADGLQIEVAEKSILWIKFKVMGKQYHASMPFMAVNANREAMRFILKLDGALHKKFDATNEIFSPPDSTFEPTKHEKNVDNINTIPGTEIQYLDCRILPKYDLDMVIDFIDSQIREFQRESKATITYEFMQKEQAPMPTRMDAPVVVELKNAIKELRGAEPSAVGIGGGTCAAFFRRKGFDAVVWSTTVPEVAHQADEYVHVSHVLKDRDVIMKIVSKD